MQLTKNIIASLLIIGALAALPAGGALAQQKPADSIPLPVLGPNDTIPVPAMVKDGEYIPSGTLEWTWVQVPYPKHLLERRKAWTRLRNAIYVTYPYARRAGAIMNDINAHIANMPESEKKKYIHSREKELKQEFTKPLSDLSIYQGKVLMKLINRETGNNCYEIIKEYKGGFTARFYQTVAFFFSTSLKQPYEKSGEDAEMEKIVQEVERMYGYRG